MKKIATLFSLIIFLFLVSSSANATTPYCNFSPEGANGQPYGDVTISSSCVIYETVNGVSDGNLTLQNSVITLNSTLVFSPGKQINIGSGSFLYINTNGKIQQSLLCIKDADDDGFADVVALENDPATGFPLTNPITQIGKVVAPIGATNCADSNPGYVNSELMNNLTMVDADPLTPSTNAITTPDRELLRLGFMINGVTDAYAGVGDIQIVNKNLLVCDGTTCPADNFLNLTPPKGNVYVGGNVGIGTTNPIRKLDILTGTSTEGIVIRSAADATNVAGNLWPGSGGFVIDSRLGNLTGAANLHLRTGGVDRIHISGTTGDISIGGTVTAPTFSGALSGNATTATTLIGNQGNWASYRTSAVANMLSWKNYGNGHVLFDASNSTSPTGSAVNNTDSQVAWTGTYPTLMGWNGANTYGVRVDRARLADNLTARSSCAWTAYTCNASQTCTTSQLVNGVDRYATGALCGTAPKQWYQMRLYCCNL